MFQLGSSLGCPWTLEDDACIHSCFISLVGLEHLTKISASECLSGNPDARPVYIWVSVGRILALALGFIYLSLFPSSFYPAYVPILMDFPTL